MNFLAAVNRLLTAEGFLSGDGEEITTFDDLQHKATTRLAVQAIQSDLVEVMQEMQIPYEKKTTGTFTTVAGTRSYSLATDFVNFLGKPMLYESSSNVELFEYPGGEEALKVSDYNYKTTQSNPWAWYIEGGTTKKVSLYPVPQEAKTYTYDYEGDVSVSASSDTMPFHNEIEAQTFCRIAAVRFKFMHEGKDLAGLASDGERITAKATLAGLMAGKAPKRSYAPVYR